LSSSSDMLYPLLVLCCQSISRCCVSVPLIEVAFRQRVYVYINILIYNRAFVPLRLSLSTPLSPQGRGSSLGPSSTTTTSLPSPGNNHEIPRKAHPGRWRVAGGSSLTAPREQPSSQNTGYRLWNPYGTNHGDQECRSEDRSDSVASSWVSLSSIGTERRH